MGIVDFLFRYSAFDALQLVSLTDEYFHCENCNGELVAESDKLAAEEMGDGDDNARKRRREKLKDMLQKMEVRLTLLTPFYLFAGVNSYSTLNKSGYVINSLLWCCVRYHIPSHI